MITLRTALYIEALRTITLRIEALYATLSHISHGGSFTTKVLDSKRLQTPKVKLGLFPYIY